MFAIGGIIAEKYLIEHVLGQGGMGVVVKATHVQLGQPVAVKFLLPEMLADPRVVQRFVREAQAVVRLKSEHVARVIDVGTLKTGAPYMVVEYLAGTDLSRFPRDQLTTGLVVDLMLQACEALAEAHAMGIIHRDIKPANFFVTRRADGSLLLKILDFGISKTPISRNENLTATQMVMGTLGYMSPEQMRSSRSADHRSDLWSLGVVLYELLQGTPPFHADSFSAMVLKVATEPLPRMTARLPGRLGEVVYRCLEKDLARRFQNVAELARALAPYAQSTAQAAVSVERIRGVMAATPPGGGSALDASPSTISALAGAITTHPRRPRRWSIVAGSAAVVAAIAVAVLATTSTGRPEPETIHAAGPSRQPLDPPAPAMVSAPPAPVGPPPPVAAAIAPAPQATLPPPPVEAAAEPVPLVIPAQPAKSSPARRARPPKPDTAAPTPLSSVAGGRARQPVKKKPTPQQPAKARVGSEPEAGSEDILGTRN